MKMAVYKPTMTNDSLQTITVHNDIINTCPWRNIMQQARTKEEHHRRKTNQTCSTITKHAQPQINHAHSNQHVPNRTTPLTETMLPNMLPKPIMQLHNPTHPDSRTEWETKTTPCVQRKETHFSHNIAEPKPLQFQVALAKPPHNHAH